MASYKINFSGLIGFVPHVKRKQVMVLMLDGRYRHRAPDGEELFPHYPFIHYNLDDLSEESLRRPELTGRGHGVNFFDLEDLTIGDQKDNELDSYLSSKDIKEPTYYGKYKDQSKVDDCGSRDLCWIMPIHKIGRLEGASEEDLALSPACVESPYKVAAENKVAARFKLGIGSLYVEDFHKKTGAGESFNTICRFRAAEGETPFHSQVISTKVTYELTPSKPLVISSTRFEDRGKFPELVFKNPADLERDVVINIWNAPFADLLDLLGGKDKHAWERPQGDRSFRSYFRLCCGEKLALPILTKEERVYATLQPAWKASLDKNVGCPTARYAAVDFDPASAPSVPSA